MSDEMGIIRKLALELEEDEATVRRFLSHASRKYKVYTIPKRRQGRRVIAQPSKRLKSYQKAFLKLYTLPVHPSAMAYKTGQSIKENVLAHCQQPYLLKMDLESFFNSITPHILWKAWEKQLPQFPKNEKKLIEQLLFWCPSKKCSGKLVLSVGAPSSPSLSNLCMHSFDETLTLLCKRKNIIYTRYADDLTFSTKHKYTLLDMPRIVGNTLTQHFDQKLLINHNKTIFSSKAHNRHVTGITITNSGTLSLGRKRKRYIKHLVNEFQYKQLSKEDSQHLQGLLALTRHIEPQFLLALQKKYTQQIIQHIFEARYE